MNLARAMLLALAVTAAGPALAQAPAGLGDSAKALIGTWEFSNADRDKTCSVTFKGDPAKTGYKLEFDKNCANLFPLVGGVVGWKFPDNGLLSLLDAEGKSLIEFSEVEDGIYEAPTPGLGVLFLQNPAAAGPPPKPPDQVSGDWAITRRGGPPVCLLALSATAAKDGFALTVKPGCDAAITRLNFSQWRLDGDELMLVPARGAPWRFEEMDGGNWSRVPEGADQIKLVRQ
jgi:hypothetical protein